MVGCALTTYLHMITAISYEHSIIPPESSVGVLYICRKGSPHQMQGLTLNNK